MFDFELTKKGNLKLESVKFLGNNAIRQKNDLLLVTDRGSVQFFLDRSTPVSHLSGEQFNFISAAARYFGYMPNQEEMPVWLWAGSLDLPRGTGQQQDRQLPMAESLEC
jgi:hypothetical protein